MSFKGKINSYKHYLAIGLAALVVATIFAPFQRASAFTVNTPTLPDATGNTLTQSVNGDNFKVTIDVQPGELISISTIQLILDNGQSTGKSSLFSSSGSLTSGSNEIVKDNTLTISASPGTSARSGYGYGYGYLGTSYTYSSYTYTQTGQGYGYIGGNTGGYTNSGVTNFVNGYLGQATITISGKLNTALIAAGSHTLDIVINTGAGGNNQDKLLAPQMTFTVNANSQIATGSVNSGTNSTTSIVASDSNPVSLRFDFVQNFGHISIEDMIPSFLKSIYSSIFNVIGSSASSFAVGSSTALTAGTIYDIDVSSITHTGFIYVTIHYDPNLLPVGMSESNVKFFHWTGTAWEDATVSVDTTANTVTGKLTSLSPVVAGYVSSTSSTTTTTTSVGGGGGGGSIVLNGTFPPGYFDVNPLAKLQIQDSSFKDLTGSLVVSAKVGQQVSIGTTFKNYQQTPQDYAIIIQVVDQNGFTTDTGWVTGTVDAGKTVDNARSWTPDAEGNYTIKIFVWNNVSTNPVPLSETTTKYFTASE